VFNIHHQFDHFSSLCWPLNVNSYNGSPASSSRNLSSTPQPDGTAVRSVHLLLRTIHWLPTFSGAHARAVSRKYDTHVALPAMPTVIDRSISLLLFPLTLLRPHWPGSDLLSVSLSQGFALLPWSGTLSPWHTLLPFFHSVATQPKIESYPFSCLLAFAFYLLHTYLLSSFLTCFPSSALSTV
jgi:hypothetical protein